ncbi:hypothetical protein ACIBL3_46330 [Kribbella sp. NPDC050124]|uniref:hypothetical protein n=1 Tax=Kribbella sp. NPDC050124 TaxID=3364114 RepID=UPI0037952A5E
MPSDLQRVARGLLDCFDEVPQVVAHLQRTADRCRENAATAIAASHGHATVAAQQLDAAARACEAAAHYLSMAPPKARAWTERLIGDSRTTNRPSSDSADRNKATGGVGDVPERDAKGRPKRLTARYEDIDLPEQDDDESPLVTVARKAFEKFRKQREKDEEHREDPEELEFEITVTETGELTIEERNEKEAQQREDHLLQDFQIAVDLTEPIKTLLATMAESTEQTWDHAEFTITPTQVEATFDYPEDTHPHPITVDITTPKLPDFDFDPAFDPLPLGNDFAPGVHDPHNTFMAKERRIADRLAEEGWRIDARVPDHTRDGLKNPDTIVRKGPEEYGAIIEFKTQESGSSNAVKRNIHEASEQAGEGAEIVLDGRQAGVSEEVAWRSFRRACGQSGSMVAAIVHVILGDGRLVTYTKEQ